MLSIVVSVALFILSLLIFFSVRSSDKKSRSLANVNAQIKSFRSEVSATTQRLLTSAQDCTDNVQSHVEKARNTVDIVNTCLDRLAQHQKDLTQLEGICEDCFFCQTRVFAPAIVELLEDFFLLVREAFLQVLVMPSHIAK